MASRSVSFQTELTITNQHSDPELIGPELKAINECTMKDGKSYSLLSVSKELAESHLKQSDLSKITLKEFGHQVNEFYLAAQLVAQPQELAEDVERAINEITQLDSDNIHAWCINGYYHQLKGNREKYEHSLQQIASLQEQPVRVMMARAVYAYWMAEMVRTEIQKEETFTEFDRILAHPALREGERPVKQACEQIRFMYLKLKIRAMKQPEAHKKAQQDKTRFRESLTSMFKLLSDLHHSEFCIIKTELVWIWLAEIHGCRNCRADEEIFNQELEKFLRESGLESVNHAKCIEKMYRSAMSEETKLDAKLLARAAKNALYYSYTVEEKPFEFEKNCLHAIKLCEKSQKLSENRSSCYKTIMSENTYGRASLILWASKYYKSHQAYVEKENARFYGCKPKSRSYALKFLSDGFFMEYKVHGSPEEMEFLQNALNHLQAIEDKPNISTSKRTCQLGKLKFLLGYSNEEVEECYKKAVNDNDLKKHDHIDALIKYGIFLEKICKVKEATDIYKEAIDYGKKHDLKAGIAHKLLKSLKQGGRDNRTNRHGRGRGGSGRGETGRGNGRGGSHQYRSAEHRPEGSGRGNRGREYKGGSGGYRGRDACGYRGKDTQRAQAVSAAVARPEP